jgi:hypothetical protein
MSWTTVSNITRKALGIGDAWNWLKRKLSPTQTPAPKKTPKSPTVQTGPGPGNHRKDMSRPILQSLQSRGYDTVQWDSGASTHDVCVALHGQRWDLTQFLSGLMHDAPLFERSHPGDKSCSLIIYCRDNAELRPIRVDSFGLQGETNI